MKVKNDFPKVDKVLIALKQYVEYFENLKVKSTDTKEIKFCENALKQVDTFISAREKYLDSVCNGEDRIRKAKEDANRQAISIEELQQIISDEDKRRTNNHSSIIMSMVMIDRIATLKGLNIIFDYAEEFQSDFQKLIPSTPQEKSKMSERERIKRREIGNFGLYIGASVTAGMHRDYMLTDDEARAFASCESDKKNSDFEIQRKVKNSMSSLKGNITNILE